MACQPFFIIKVYFSILSLIYVPMENKHVVLKQYGTTKNHRQSTYLSGYLRSLSHPYTTQRSFFPMFDNNNGLIYIRYRKVEISFKRSLKIPENRIQQSFVYIRTKLNFTANPAVCPLSDHVTVIFSRQHQGALKDG